MGRKYASIHIFTDDPDHVLPILKRHLDHEDRQGATIRLAREMIKNKAALMLFEGMMRVRASQKTLVVQSGSIVSIYDEWLSFETVEEEARMLSTIVDRPVVYTSNFDDDVLLFGVYRSGHRLTGGNAGQGLATYGITPETLDIARFRAELGIGEPGALETLNAKQSLWDMENELEKWLHVPLDVNVEDVRSDKEHYEKRAVGGRLQVYRRR